MKKYEIQSLINGNSNIAIAYKEWKKTNPYRDNDIIDMYSCGGLDCYHNSYVYIKYKAVNKKFEDEYEINIYDEIVNHQLRRI